MSIDDIQTWSESLVGQTLADRYRLDAIIGVGAMGTVFRARHLGLNRDVALKLLNVQLTDNAEMQARFSREAAAASKLDHSNCVRVTDYGLTGDGHQYLVMELLEGIELADILDQPLPIDRALSVMDQLLAGLEHAHGRGLVHRDVKPENVFLTRDAEGVEQAKLLDFGIVKLEDNDAQPLTRFGMVFGTPQYMSPEQASGKPTDARTDLYAAGVVLYTMLAGRPPFEADDPVVLLRMQMKATPEPLPSTVPEALRELVGRLMAKVPDERPASATAVRQALARIQAELKKPVVTEPEPSLSRHLERLREPKIQLAVGGGFVALALVIGIAVRATGRVDADEGSTDTVASSEAGSAKSGSGNDADPETPAADESGAGQEGDDGEGGDRALDANLAAIDALVAAKKYDAAEIALAPLLSTYPDEPKLHWRMARVLIALRGNERRAQALESYRKTLTLEPELLQDEILADELGALLDDPKLRTPAIDFTIDLLGADGHDRLLGWLNTQAAPLPYATRHRIMSHVESGGRGQDINRPLQRALDLWQASGADEPCEAFEQALETATEEPDSYLLGTLQTVSVPSAGSDSGEACPGLDEKLASTRARHQQLYAGIDGVVPKAYRRRKSTGGGGRRRRR